MLNYSLLIGANVTPPAVSTAAEALKLFGPYATITDACIAFIYERRFSLLADDYVHREYVENVLGRDLI